jgi:hypothetical protein
MNKKPTQLKTKCRFAAALLCLLLLCPSPAQAADLGKIIGIGKAIHSALGKTTVTPTYAIGGFVYRYYGFYRDYPHDFRRRVTLDMHTGQYHYEFAVLMPSDDWFRSYSPFRIQRLARLNKVCDLSAPNPDGGTIKFIFKELEDFRVYVWAHSVVNTGAFPPGPPYGGFLKSYVTRLTRNCDPITPFSAPIRQSFSISDSGHTSVAMGEVNSQYTWPMVCWIGSNMFKYGSISARDVYPPLAVLGVNGFPTN